MMRITKRVAAGVVVSLLAVCAGLAALPEVPAEAVDALGVTTGTPQTSGFVFIDGKYVPPPYTVTRRGNGIFINRIQVDQPVPWIGTPLGEAPPKKLDDDGDFEVVDEDAEEADEDVAPVGELDDLLFGDAMDADKKTGEAHAIDALFDDVTPAKNTAQGRKQPQVQPAAEAMSKQQVEEMKTKLNTLRKVYETALGRGDIYFFAQHHSRVNGTYGSAKTLLTVLPSALRSARSPQELMAKLNQGGVYFLDLATCADLHRNRTSFVQLDERRKQIEADEAAKRTTGRTR